MRTTGTASVLVSLLILTPSAPARADESPALAPGQRIRVTRGDALSRGTLTGTLRGLDSESLVIGAESEWNDQDEIPRRVRRDAIVKLEIQTRTADRTAAALKGLGVGLLAGVAYVVVQTQLNNGSALCDSARVCDAEVLIGATLGAGVGAAVGAGFARPEWTEIPLPPREEGATTEVAVGPPAPPVNRRWR